MAGKTKAQLLTQLKETQKRVSELEAAQTEGEQSTTLLKESESKFRLMYEDAPLGYQSLDGEGRLIEVNQAWLDTLGYQDREEVIGRWFGEFMIPEHQDLVKERFPRFKASGRLQGAEFEMARKDGSTLIVSIDGRIAYDEEGEFQRTHCILHDKTQQAQAEQALQEAEEQYREFVEGTDDLITQVDAEGNFTYVNHVAEKAFGLPPEECIGLSAFDFVHPDDWEATTQAFAGWLEEKVTKITIENRQVSRTGEVRHFLWNSNPHYDEQGSLTHINGIARDITERKQAEDRYRIVSELATDYTFVYRIEPDGQFELEWATDAFSRMSGYSVEELQEQGTLSIIHPEDLPLIETRVEKLSQGETVVDEFRILNKNGDIRWISSYAQPEWDEAKERVVRYYGASKDITERKQAEEELRESEEKYRNLVERANDGVIIAQDAIVKFVNPRMAEIFGYTVAEMIDTEFLAYVHPEERPRIIDIYKRRIQGEDIPSIYEMEALHKDGRRIEVEINSGITNYHGKPATLSFARDITERKQAEEALRESEEKYRNLVERANDGVSIVQNGKVKFVNARMAEMFGYSIDEITGADFMEYVHPEERPRIIDIYQRRTQGEDMPSIYEMGALHKDGMRFEVDVNSGNINYHGTLATLTIIRDITERKQAEEALRESEEKHRLLFETMAQGVVYQDAEGNIFSANPAAERVLGLTQDQMMGRTSMDPRWRSIHEDGADFPGETHPAMVALKTGESVNDVIMGVFLPEKEEYRWLRINAVPQIREGEEKPYQVYTTFTDITESRQAEQALQESEALYRDLVETSQDLIWKLDSQGRFTYLNEAWEGTLGYKIEEMLGKPITDFKPEDVLERDRKTFQQIVAGGQVKGYETVYLTANGDRVNMIFTAKPILDADGQITGTQGTAHDITERVKAEYALQEYSVRLEEMVEERTLELKDAQDALFRQEKLAFLGELAGSVSHEIRTPLSVINNAVYFLGAVLPDAGEEVKEYLGIIDSEILEISRIVTDTLDITRVNMPEKEKAKIAEMVSSTLERKEPPENVEVVLNIPAEIPSLFVDPRQIQQVLVNLVRNGCDAMKDGGVLVIEALEKEGRVDIQVTDTGVGIPAENLEKIFEPLFSTKSRGLGLGLAICVSLVEANGGTISVESEEGIGSAFTVSLPVE